MGDSNGGWVFADTWVLAAIGVYGRPCSLTEVIAAADWINQAILLDDEVEAALGKLTGAGLIRVFEEWIFELTDEGTSLWSWEGRDMRSQLDLMESQLSEIEPGTGTVKLPDGAMDHALKEYRRSPRR